MPLKIRHSDFESDYREEIGTPYTDNLTGFFNHGFFQLSLEHEIKRSKRYQRIFTLALINIDSFSFYNIQYGPLQGDRILKVIADVIRSNIRESDLVARYAGDMFAIILTETDAAHAAETVERMRNAIEHLTASRLTVSVGLAEYSRTSERPINLLQDAEEALRQAKDSGANKIIWLKDRTKKVDDTQAKVLIVDDDARNLKLLEALLAPLNYNVVKAAGGKEALHLVNKMEVDLILMDVMMPEMDGFEACRHLKSQNSTRLIPVILVTALDDMESKIKGIEAGADDFISKPPNKMQLLARTRSLIKLKKLNNNLTSIENVLFSLAKTVEAKDRYTQGHVERVADMAELLGEKMGLPAEDIKALRYGGILHDIGKIGIPIEILNKPGPLNDKERKIMQRHPDIGYKICLPLRKTIGPALDIIRHHHEKLDGSGYPDGLKGDEISIVARIMAAVDIFDAIISDRPYRKGLPIDEVISILKKEAKNGKLDSAVVRCLNDTI